MNNFLKNIKTGLSIGIGFILIVFLSGIVYSAWTNIPELKKSSGEYLTSETWNNLVDNVDYLNSGLQQIPIGLISAFNLEKCPTGWKASDGTAGTLDLRGKFIRGLNSFDGGQTRITGDASDIDGINRTLGSFQNDAIRNITGKLSQVGNRAGIQYGYGAFYADSNITRVAETSESISVPSHFYFDASRSIGVEHVGADIRPKNIALIYCEKE